MRDIDIEKGNKSITQLMGEDYFHWTHDSGTSWLSVRGHKDGVFNAFTHFIDIPYYVSWDWLMPVIKKIREEIDFSIYENGEDYFMNILDNLDHIDIRKTYNAIVECIKWYNNENI